MPVIESLMEAQTPTVQPDEGGLRTLDRAHADASTFGGQIGQALEGLGGEISRFAQIHANDQQQLQGFQRQKSWQDFMAQEDQHFMTAQRGVSNGAQAFTKNYMNGGGATATPSAPPPDASGVPAPDAGNLQDQKAAAGPSSDGGFNGRLNAWLNANIPADATPKERAQWEAQGAEFKRQMGVKALDAEFKARDQYYNTTIGNELERVSSSISTTPTGIDNYVKQGDAIIDASGLSAEDKTSRKSEWHNQANMAYGLAKATLDPDGVATAMGSPKAGYYAKVAQHESGGSQQNGLDNGNHGGLYQFEPGTWSRLVNTPEGRAAGLTEGGKTDPTQQQEAIQIFTKQNAGVLTAAGIPTTEKNLYMAHFLGAGGASTFLKAMAQNPNDAAENHVGKGVADNNASIFYDKTGRPRTLAEVYNLQTKEYNGQPVNVSDPRLAAMPYEQQQHVLGVAETQSAQQAAAASAAQANAHTDWYNSFLLGIHDGSINTQDITTARQNGQLTNYSEIKQAEDILAQRDAQTDSLARYGAKTANNQAFNPFDSEDKKAANAAVTAATKNGEDPFSASMKVFSKTGLLPDVAATAMHGGLISSDLNKVQTSATLAGNMVASRPNAFAGVTGGNDLEKAGIDYNHFTNDLGMSAADAAKRIQAMNDPTYKSKLKVDDTEAKSFTDDMRKNAEADITKAFDPRTWGTWAGYFVGMPQQFAPSFPSPEQRGAMSADYAELAAQRYQETGDKDGAKAYAVAQMKKMYGVSNGYLMKYPPEKVYPADPDGKHDYIYQQAADTIKSVTGETVDPSAIYLMPIENVTANAWKAGTPPPYAIHYTGETDGFKTQNVIMRPGATAGRPWVPDTSHIADQHAQVSNERAIQFREGRTLQKGIQDYIPAPHDFTEDANESPLSGAFQEIGNLPSQAANLLDQSNKSDYQSSKPRPSLFPPKPTPRRSE